MDRYRLSPWSLKIKDGNFIVENKISTNIRYGTKYIRLINKFLPKHDLTFSMVFFADGGNDVSYFLALTKDKLPTDFPMVSNGLNPDVQITIVNFDQLLISDNIKQTFHPIIKIGKQWLFLPKDIKINPTSQLQQQLKYNSLLNERD